MGWRTLYIEKSNYLSCYLDNLQIENGIDKLTIPFSDIDSIIIDNRYMNISIGFLNKCIENKINLIICDAYHLPESSLLSFSSNYQSYFVFNKQLKWNNDYKSILWQSIVKAKIKNQIRVLLITKKSSNSINILEKYLTEVQQFDYTNREGLAAKIYFKEIFGNNFVRQKDDTINSCLNYGYTILRSMICRTIVVKGLNPNIGIFHKGPNNKFNLADDIIEVFRPIVDLWVLKNINQNSVFNKEVRTGLVELMTKKILYENKISISNAISIYVDKIIAFFDTGEISNLKFPDIEYYE